MEATTNNTKPTGFKVIMSSPITGNVYATAKINTDSLRAIYRVVERHSQRYGASLSYKVVPA